MDRRCIVQPKVALVVAVCLATAAVALVALDLAYTLQARIETGADGNWVTVADDKGRFYEPFPARGDCPDQPLRLVVDNDKPLSATVLVSLSYTDRMGGGHSLLHEEVSLGRFEVRTFNFDVPPSAFEEPTEDPRFGPGSVFVTAVVEDLYLSTCVEAPA